METKQPSTSQNLAKTEIQQQIGPNNSKLFVIVVIGILLTAMITGSVVYFWQKSVSEKVISGLEQKISFLEKQILSISKEKETLPPKPPSLQITDPTANWETYVDDSLDYLIKYPGEFGLKEKAPNVNYIVIKKPGGEVEGTGAFSHFTIAIEGGPKVSSLEDAILHFQNQSRQISGEDMQFTPTINKDLNGVKSLYYYQDGPIGYQQNYVLFNNNQKLIHINVIFANLGVQKNEQNEVDQILSTLRLTN